MKFIKFLFLTSIFIVINSALVMANSVSTIRVGLESIYKDVSSTVIMNDSISVGYSEGEVLYDQINLTANSNFYVSMPIMFFVDLNMITSTYDEAQRIASGYNNAVVGYLDNNKFTVLIKETTLDSANSTLTKHTGATLAPIYQNKTVLHDGNEIRLVFLNSDKKAGVRGSNGNYISVGNRKYRGYLEVYGTSNGNFTLVNVVPFEEYLYAVVPSEMPSAWNKEALKAQAVSARTYAMTQMSKHSSNGYNVCDKEHCQMYLGVTNEANSTTNAVIETNGEKAYYDGKLIETVFYSSSGGVTANSEDVWASPLAYLREKVDPYDREGLVWTRSITTNDILGMLTKANQNIGTPTAISIDEVSSNGRINKLTIIGTTGSHTLTKESIRTFFSYNGQPSLQSRLFNIVGNYGSNVENIDTQNTINHDVYVENNIGVKNTVTLNGAKVQSNLGTFDVVSNNIFIKSKDTVTSFLGNPGKASTKETIQGTQFVISGKGYGHGVGLSQYGAKGMAEQGFTYKEILKFYYTGVDVY